MIRRDADVLQTDLQQNSLLFVVFSFGLGEPKYRDSGLLAMFDRFQANQDTWGIVSSIIVRATAQVLASCKDPGRSWRVLCHSSHLIGQRRELLQKDAVLDLPLLQSLLATTESISCMRALSNLISTHLSCVRMLRNLLLTWEDCVS